MNPEDEEFYNPWAKKTPIEEVAPVTAREEFYNPWKKESLQETPPEEEFYNPWRKAEEPTPEEAPANFIPGVNDQFDETGKPLDERPTLSADQIRQDPKKMSDIRTYMVRRKGVYYKDVPDEEVYDDFINQMRWFSTNELSTTGELVWLQNLPEEEKAIAGNAYRAFDDLGNMFTNDGFMGAIDGVKDYAFSNLAAPSSYVGVLTGGIGKAVTGATTLAAREAAVKTLTSAAVKSSLAASRAAGLTAAAAKVEARAAAAKAIAGAARASTLKHVAAATVADASANTFQDYMYQSALIEADVKDTYSFLELGLSAAAGVVGGAFAAAPHLTRGSSKLTDVAGHVEREATHKAAEAAKKAAPEMRVAVAKFQEKMADWSKSVANGDIVAGDSRAMGKKAMELLLDTNKDSETSIVAAMIRAGVKADTRENAPTISHQMVSFALSLPEKELDELDVIFKGSTGTSYREFVDVLANTSSEAGTSFNQFSQAAKALGDRAAAKAAADGIIEKGTEAAGKAAKEVATPQKLLYVQNVWKRALTSHIGTTMANLQGWSQVFSARALSETLHGGILGTLGLAAKLTSPITGKAMSDELLSKSGHLFAAQAFRLKTLFDPYATRDAVEALLQTAPKSAKKKMDTLMSGGMEYDNPAHYGFGTKDAKGNIVQNRGIRKLESVLDKAGSASLMKAQDSWTKSFSVITALDRQTRLTYKTSLVDMIENGRIDELTDEMWHKAINSSLEDTMAQDFTKGFGHLSKVADAIESISKLPGVGFLFPFGRFVNNNLAFILQYSPVSFFHIAAKAKKKGFFGTVKDDDLMSAASKMLVGTSALMALAAYQGKQEEAGLAWNQRMDSTGDIIDQSNLAPGSAYLLMGRIANLWMRGEHATSDEIMRDLGDQLVLGKLLRDASESDVISETFKYMISTTDDEAERKSFMGFATELAKTTLGDIGSGFTRPLEPLNAVVGVITGNDVQNDKRLARGVDGVKEGFFRYLDNVFSLFAGDKDGMGVPQEGITKPGPLYETNPLSRLAGSRRELPQTNADKVLAMTNKPIWTVQERTGIPEWDHVMNSVATPMLEEYATYLLKSKLWKEGNMRTREHLVETMLTTIKKRVRDSIASGSDEGDLLNQRRKFLTLDESLRAKAKAALDIRVDDRDLTEYQLMMLKQYIDDYKSVEKDFFAD